MQCGMSAVQASLNSSKCCCAYTAQVDLLLSFLLCRAMSRLCGPQTLHFPDTDPVPTPRREGAPAPAPCTTAYGTGTSSAAAAAAAIPWSSPTLVSTLLAPEARGGSPTTLGSPSSTASTSGSVGTGPGGGGAAGGARAGSPAFGSGTGSLSPVGGGGNGAFRFPKPWVGSSSLATTRAVLTPDVLDACRTSPDWWSLPCAANQ
jgi:hypothetical protein